MIEWMHSWKKMMVNLTENAWNNLGHSCSTLPKMPNAVAGNAATNSLQSITPLNDWYPHIACRCHLRFISTLNSLYPSRPLESASFNFWPQGWWLSLCPFSLPFYALFWIWLDMLCFHPAMLVRAFTVSKFVNKISSTTFALDTHYLCVRLSTAIPNSGISAQKIHQIFSCCYLLAFLEGFSFRATHGQSGIGIICKMCCPLSESSDIHSTVVHQR